MFDANTKVLVIDDMRTMRKIVIKCLGEIGLKSVTEADDGATGWEAIQKALTEKAPFQLIISDWNMPILKGIELLKKVRADAAMKSTPFFLVTAETELSQVSEAAQAGVSGYITKPFSPATLKEKLEKASAKK